MFGGIPLTMLVMGAGTGGGPPVFLLLLFPAIAMAVMVPVTRRALRVGFTLADDGIHGAHDAEDRVLPWGEIDRIVWRWAEETSGVTVNGRPLPDGYALHAVLADGRAVRLMQRVAAKYGQQQALNEQMARANAAGALPVPFDATVPTHDGGAWSGTPPSPSAPPWPPSRHHTTWDGDDLPPVGDSPLADAGSHEPADDGPVWPSG